MKSCKENNEKECKKKCKDNSDNNNNNNNNNNECSEEREDFNYEKTQWITILTCDATRNNDGDSTTQCQHGQGTMQF